MIDRSYIEEMVTNEVADFVGVLASSPDLEYSIPSEYICIAMVHVLIGDIEKVIMERTRPDHLYDVLERALKMDSDAQKSINILSRRHAYGFNFDKRNQDEPTASTEKD